MNENRMNENKTLWAGGFIAFGILLAWAWQKSEQNIARLTDTPAPASAGYILEPLVKPGAKAGEQIYSCPPGYSGRFLDTAVVWNAGAADDEELIQRSPESSVYLPLRIRVCAADGFVVTLLEQQDASRLVVK